LATCKNQYRDHRQDKKFWGLKAYSDHFIGRIIKYCAQLKRPWKYFTGLHLTEGILA
jgi:hypothetical protein